ncbi:MAG: hypothetical protein QNL39_14080 [Akkermansiaceae bacterium]
MKTTQKTILTTLLASTLAVGMTFAQRPGGGGPRGGGPGGERPLPPVMEALDTDEDDDDKKKSRRKPHVSPIMKALDADEDGEISKEELEGAAEALAELDQNKAGKLSRMETRPNRGFKPKQKKEED